MHKFICKKAEISRYDVSHHNGAPNYDTQNPHRNSFFRGGCSFKADETAIQILKDRRQRVHRQF